MNVAAWLAAGASAAATALRLFAPFSRRRFRRAIRRYVDLLDETGATCDPSDYLDDLGFCPPNDAADGFKAGATACVCCCAPFFLDPAVDGAWVGITKKTRTAEPMCGACLCRLVAWHRRSCVSFPHSPLPSYDTIGQQLREIHPNLRPDKLAAKRLRLIHDGRVSPHRRSTTIVNLIAMLNS